MLVTPENFILLVAKKLTQKYYINPILPSPRQYTSILFLFLFLYTAVITTKLRKAETPNNPEHKASVANQKPKQRHPRPPTGHTVRFNFKQLPRAGKCLPST